MIDTKYLIVGGGPAGVGALDVLGTDALLVDNRSSLGGLCSSFQINGFSFDHSVHLSFTQIPEVKKYIEPIEQFHHNPVSLNYWNGLWLKHPAQNNLFPLPLSEKNSIIEDFKKRPKIDNPINYHDWLISSFGEEFTNSFSELYTSKYWCVESKSLSTSWCGNRQHLPSIDEVIEGANKFVSTNFYYAKQMNYPTKGGYQSFFGRTSFSKQIRLNSVVSKIDSDLNIVTLTDGSQIHYQKLFSSIPLSQIDSVINKCPQNITMSADKLKATSMADVSVGFKNANIKIPSLWFYIYDLAIPFARCYCPSMKSINNVPKGKASLQFEHYYIDDDKYSDNELANAARKFVCENIAKEEDIEFIHVSREKFANVVFLMDMEKYRDIVLSYLIDHNIIPIGRFGKWEYLWSDQAYMSGRIAAEKEKGKA